MRIFVKAKPGNKEDKVIPPPLRLPGVDSQKEYYTLYTKEPPMEGRANDAYVRLLAEHFGVSRSAVRLLSGAASKTKVFEILQ
jgi:uncharacterized protein YggU (UPF0235/DUF167 family)